MVLSKEELGILIKSARKIKSKNIESKYTQEMLAKDIGISRSYLGDIEAGRTYPNYVLLNKIAAACEVPFSYFGDMNDVVLKMIDDKYPNMALDERRNFANYICDNLECEVLSRDVDLEVFKNMYDDTIDKTGDYHPSKDDLLEPHKLPKNNNDNSAANNEINDVKQAMELILSQPGLMLNGELLSDESKIALANAIKMGLAYAEQMQEKENKNTKKK